MTRRSFLFASLVLALVLSAVALAGKPAVDPSEVEELARGTDAPLLLDVRSPEEFAAGHMPGAVNIPHDALGSRLSEIDAKRPVLVYCQSGRRAGLAEGVLSDAGFEVRQIDGSWERWTSEGRPVEMPATAVTTE